MILKENVEVIKEKNQKEVKYPGIEIWRKGMSMLQFLEYIQIF